MSDNSNTYHNLFGQFSRVYCISLIRSIERRKYIFEEFARVGIVSYEFVDAYDKDSKEVTELYQSGFVKKYPPCFRCGRDSCNCSNKSLFRPQIGNWLSHIEAWKNISEDKQGLSLVCEDDLKFQDTIYQSLGMLARSEEILHKLETAEPVLVRFGWALSDEHALCSAPILTQDIKMANPCYAINSVMAKYLLESLEEISTTSDVYLHRIIGSTVNHYTVMPPPVYELSWSTGEMISEIRPKEKRVEYLLSKLKNLDRQDSDYQATKASYENELARLKQFVKYNDSPSTNYEDDFHLI